MYVHLVFFTLFASLFRVFLADEFEELGLNCSYTTDMSDMDTENCLRKLKASVDFLQNSRMRECFGLYYGRGLLHKGRGDIIHFSVEVEDPSDYPDDFAYTIVSRKAENWTVKNSVSQIDGCERMTKNDDCTLPEREKGESQFAYFPLKDDDDDWFCEFIISDNIVVKDLTWCEIKEEVGCIYNEDGKVTQRGKVTILSSDQVPATYDYCIFPMDEDYFKHYDYDRDLFAVSHINVTGNANETFAKAPGKIIQCEVENNLTLPPFMMKQVLEEYETEEEYACYFFRFPKNEWYMNPMCHKRSNAEGSAVIAIVIIITSSAIVLAVIVVLMWLYKTQLKKCSFKRNIEDMPRPLAAQRSSEIFHESGKKPDNNNGLKEVIDPITFSPCEKKMDSSVAKVDILSAENDDDCLRMNEDIAEETPLYEGPDSGFHSIKNEEGSTKPSGADSGLSDVSTSAASPDDSGLIALESTSSIAQTVPPMSEIYIDKQSFQQPNGKAFPSYVKKNFLEQDSVTQGSTLSPAATGYTSKDELRVQYAFS